MLGKGESGLSYESWGRYSESKSNGVVIKSKSIMTSQPSRRMVVSMQSQQDLEPVLSDRLMLQVTKLAYKTRTIDEMHQANHE